jgi:hypothetical protein
MLNERFGQVEDKVRLCLYRSFDVIDRVAPGISRIGKAHRSFESHAPQTFERHVSS